ncbi:MAG TPA: transposase [Vicinamibacteria bacterium]|nr:transposase [Vicinamibacteria bacterium]
MTQSSMLSIGMDVQQDAIAGADVAPEPGAAVTALGPIGTRQGAMAHLLRKRPSKAPPRLLVYDAAPCGDWLSRYLTPTGPTCWVVAPARMPQKAGARVKPDRRDAGPLARLMRSGELTPVSGPTGEDDAMGARSRAREATMQELQAAKCRLNACLLRQDSR